MKNINIIRITDLPFKGFEELRRESLSEGFNFLLRLERDWLADKNRFDREGEGYYAAYCGSELWAVLGINQAPYFPRPGFGKIRRFYVKKDKRGQGIGSYLLAYLIREHRAFFYHFSLYTDQESAACFYESYGFKRYKGELKMSHVLEFENTA